MTELPASTDHAKEFRHPTAAWAFLSKPFGSALGGQAGSDAARELFWFLVPIIAVTSFQASASQMAYLFVWRDVPVILFGLFTGVALDRVSIRKMLVGTCLCFAVLLILAPLALGLPTASLVWLYVMSFLVGSLIVILDIGSTTILPRLVERQRLVAGNSRMMVARSTTGVLMPALGGAVLTVLAPSIGFLFASVAALLAAYAYWTVPGTIEAQKPIGRVTVGKVFNEMREGFHILFDMKVLRAVILSSCAGAFGYGAGYALLVFSLARELALEPFMVGVVVALGSVGNVLGSVLCSRVTRAMGEGRAMLFGNSLAGVGYGSLAIAVVTGFLPLAIAAVAIAGFGAPIYAINQISIRQAITPHHLMGRANATRRFIVFSFIPLGALTAGWVADAVSTSAGLSVAVMGMGLATIIGLFSPLRARRIPGVTH